MQVRVVGAGGVGGVLGGLLARAGHAVELVARGAHAEAIARDGLRVELPDAAFTVRSVPVEPDLVLLAVKSGDTEAALADIPDGLPVVCAQNGVDNEPRVARRHVAHGMMVWLPAMVAEPGCVRGYGTQPPAVLALGRWPTGSDTVDAQLAAALTEAGCDAVVVDDVRAWKYGKLLRNLGNIVDAAIESGPEARIAADALMAEGAAVLDAAGIAVVDPSGGSMRYGPVGGERRPGGSTWQSLARGAALETPWLNGVIVRLGRELGVPTPRNEAALEVARSVRAPRSLPASVLG